jgi:fucose 4-O-acetylase-like acetyltransferase
MKNALPDERNLRSANADILKAISILAVVFIHGSGMILFSLTNLDLSTSTTTLAAKGLRFCVPIFIFLWAYFMEKSTIKKGKQNAMTRFYKLLIPFVFWSTVYFVLTADFKTLTLTSTISKHWLGYGWSGQYYFIILFQLILLFPVFHIVSSKLQNYYIPVFVLSLLFLIIISYSGWFRISIVDKLNDRPFFYWIPYVILGIIYAQRNIFKFPVRLSVGIISLAFIPLEIYFLHPKSEGIYLLPSVFICTLILLSSMESKLSYEALPRWIAVSVQQLSGQTLGIFCLNPLVILTLSPLLVSLNVNLQLTGLSIFMPILSTLLVTVICLIIIYLLKRVKLGILVAN